MKVLIVYESMFGNTEHVARAVAEGVGTVAEVTLVEVCDAPPAPDPDTDLVVVGGPTHVFSMTRERTRADAARQGGRARSLTGGIREWIDGLPRGSRAQRVVTFDTRAGKGKHVPGSAAKAAARAVRHHGYTTGHPESFWVADVEGPLLEGELERARAWARGLVDGSPQPVG